MARYTFALDTNDDVVQAGTVQAGTFEGALELLGNELPVKGGDKLQIGVSGFPPAHFQCISLMGGSVLWAPAEKAA